MIKICPYCSKEIDCSSSYRKYSGHLGLCSHNPEYDKRREAISIRRLAEKVEYELNCLKCNSNYIVKATTNAYLAGNYKKFCSRKCANSRERNLAHRENISLLMKNSSKAIEAMSRLHILNEARFAKKIKLIHICSHCKKEFTHKFKNKKYCSHECRVLGGNIGGYRKGSGIGKHSIYKGFDMDSNLELDVAKFLDDNNIRWIKNIKRFHFEWNGKKTYYIPDFYIIDRNLYLETKGFWNGDKKEKTLYAADINEINLVVLMQKDWNKDRSVIFKLIDFQ